MDMADGLCLESPPIISAMGIPRHGEASCFDRYVMPEHWSFHIYAYQATLELDGEVHRILPGDASLVPPGVPMVFRYQGPSEHVYFHFKLVDGKRVLRPPRVLTLGTHYEAIDRKARIAVARRLSDPGFALSTLWSLLWEYSDLGTGRTDQNPHAMHPLVAMATRHLEQQLSTNLSVRKLCEQVGVSEGYLTRVFQRELGLSVTEYSRRLRAEQALHLLTSTNMPIKTIARTVGYGSLSQFNRLLHRVHGQGPRSLRNNGLKD